jgi:hypothetical protein
MEIKNVSRARGAGCALGGKELRGAALAAKNGRDGASEALGSKA